MKYILFIILFILHLNSNGQKAGAIRKFFQVSRYEKLWALTHPFIAIKAWKISKEALAATEELKHDTLFDGDADGGQLDAFRHTYWMASLAQKIKPHKARKLGIAHEKGNYLDFKKGRIEEESIPDSIASEMDYRNNEIGIETGLRQMTLSRNELKNLIKTMVLSGKTWKIYKDKNRNSVDCNGNIIPKTEYLRKWNNCRCIVKSDIKKL